MSSRSLAGVVVLALALVAPSTSDAQIGGLIKKKVGSALGDKADKAAPGSQRAEAADQAPTFDDRVLEITAQRVDQLLKGLAAERSTKARLAQDQTAAKKRLEAERSAWQVKQKEYERQMAVYEPKARAHQKCVMDAHGAVLGQAMKQQDPEVASLTQKIGSLSESERNEFEERMEALEEPYQAAEQRGDKAAMAKIEDEGAQIIARYTGMTAAEAKRVLLKMRAQGDAAGQQLEAAAKKCGPEPKAPADPGPEPSDAGPSESSIGEAGVKASGLTDEQYAVLRERVAAYVLVDGNVPSGYVFSPGERDVLKRRLAELKAYRAELKGEG